MQIYCIYVKIQGYMEIKMNKHNSRRILFDFLRDINKSKYSLTKFAALIGIALLIPIVIISLLVMWKNKVIDHVLIIEIVGFILTLLGFKNGFGFNSSSNDYSGNVDGGQDGGQMGGDGQDGGKCVVKKPKENADFVNDTLKGQK
jgi:hypothetical protein